MNQEEHFNNPDFLPPVDCPLLIKVETGEVVKVRRTGFIRSRSDDMEYRTEEGALLFGRYPWTYP